MNEAFEEVSEEIFESACMDQEEELDYPTTVEEVVDGLPELGYWTDSVSRANYLAVANSLHFDYELEFEDMKDIVETLYRASVQEFNSRS